MTSELRKEVIAKWAGGQSKEQQIITLFERVRDIPYGDIGSRNAEDVYRNNKGTCSGKHELLKELYQELGIEIRDFIALHKFKDLSVIYPNDIKEILERSDIIDPHNFFKIKIRDAWIHVDVTWDIRLKKAGFSVNEQWDGIRDMKICVVPLEIIETENPMEFKKQEIAKLSQSVQDDRKLFLQKLTEWVETLR